MRPRHGRVSRLAMPARALAQRFALLLLVTAALSLLILGKTHERLLATVRAGLTDAIAPVLDVVSRPVEAANRVALEGERLWTTYRDNADLRERVERLQQWQTIARRLEQENALLRAQLNLRMEPRPYYISARVIGDSGGPFVRTVLLNAGRRDGVENAQAAVTGDGLAGRVVEVGERSSRLLLVTDLNSRVPVLVEGSRYRAVLAGDNSERPRLTYLPANAKVSPGDRVVTSGHGGVFPPGMPVGVVAAVHESEIRVQPFVDLDRLEYVTVYRFDLPRLEPPSQSAAAGVPGPKP